VASVQLILEVVASKTAGGGLDFRVPFIGMKLRLGATVTKKDTHTIDITFAITQTGTISLGADGELAGGLTHTLRLGLAPAGPPQNDGHAG